MAKQKYHWVEKINDLHTPGNSSGIVDDASLVVIGSEIVGKVNGLAPRARVVATATIGSEPTIMFAGPTPAAEKALAKAPSPPFSVSFVEGNVRETGLEEADLEVQCGLRVVRPPSIGMCTPVMNRESSLTRKSAARAMSQASPA